MRKKQEIEQFCASQEVIRNYIDYVKLQGGNPAHHQARVLVNKLVIAYAILFPIYCIVTGNFVSTNMRTGELSYFLVASFTSCIVAMGLAAVLFIYVLRIRLEHTFIGGRIDEMIEIVDDKLFYIFRIKYQTPADKRNIVVIDLNRINNLGYDDKLFEISIDGMMVEKIVNTSTDVHKIKISKMVDSNIKINDYFTPSLYEVLKSKIN